MSIDSCRCSSAGPKPLDPCRYSYAGPGKSIPRMTATCISGVGAPSFAVVRLRPCSALRNRTAALKLRSEALGMRPTLPSSFWKTSWRWWIRWGTCWRTSWWWWIRWGTCWCMETFVFGCNVFFITCFNPLASKWSCLIPSHLILISVSCYYRSIEG